MQNENYDDEKNFNEIKLLLEQAKHEKHILETSIEKLYLPLMIYAVAMYKDKPQKELKGICEYIGMDFGGFKNMIKLCKVHYSNDLKKFKDKNKTTKNKKSKVGYGNPPVETRFQKGNKGNQKGRKPKKDANLIDLLADELTKRIAITKNGKKKYIQ